VVDLGWARARFVQVFLIVVRELKLGGPSGRVAPEGGGTRPEVMMRRFGPIWRTRWSAIASVLLSLALVACVSRRNTNGSSANATLSAFSGSTNPTWELEDEQVGALRDVVNSLTPTDKAFDTGRLLPCAGFYVEAQSGTIARQARHLEVYDGVILLLDKDLEPLGHLNDPECKVETYLFETAERHVEPGVYDGAFDRFRKLTTE